MKVLHSQFHPMLGHVADGTIIIAPSGKEFTLKNTMKGWHILGPDNLPISGNLQSAHDVTYFVVNGLYSH